MGVEQWCTARCYRPALSTATSTASCAIRRYVVSFPPTTVTTPVAEVRTACRRDRSAVARRRRAAGAEPGVRPDDVGAGERARERGRRGLDQEVDLGLARLGNVGYLSVDRDVGESDVDQAVRLGDDVEEAGALTGDRQRQGDPQPGERLGPQHEVGPATRPQLDVVDQVARPVAGGVDDRLRADVYGSLRSARRGARHCAPGELDGRERGYGSRRRGWRRCARPW